MRLFFDTSIIVAGLITHHPHYNRARPWLADAQSGKHEWFLSHHSLAEVYSIITAYPARPRVSPYKGYLLVSECISSGAHIVTLTEKDYLDTLKMISERGIAGGAVYDALLARSALIAKVEKVLTFNPDHFRRVWPEGEAPILVP